MHQNRTVFDVVLVTPEIPPNTGNVIRTCANTGGRLHLVQPLGFNLSNANLRRAGLDYHDMTSVTLHSSWQAVRADMQERRWLAFTSAATQWHTSIDYQPLDVLVFGRESDGLPAGVLADFEERHRVRIPMVAGSRSINLANAVAVGVFEAWRQLGFPGAV